ncbi:MAG: MFS transporter [Bacteroidetes bacterium]|nr:MAG: MFS transporter [Bacteroidota bacterium]
MAKRKPYNTSRPPAQPFVPIPPPLRVLVLYATGQLGWSLSSFSVANLLIYFYMPPETGAPIFPAFIHQGAVLGILTLVGILSAAGRVFDALIDPVVANWSDRSRAGMGKRRWFLLYGALPFAISGFLVFVPIAPAESAGNFMWLALCLLAYYFFFTFYVIPYTALIAELGHTATDRMRISTYIAVAWALGFVAGNSIYALQGYFEQQGMASVKAFQAALLLVQGCALVFMLLPALLLNEKRYARQVVSPQPLRQSIFTVLGNANFRRFLWSDLFYWLALSFVQLGIGFYTTLLLELDKSYAFVFSLVSFVTSFLFYAPVNLLVARLGKKNLLLLAFLLFAMLFALVAAIRHIPIPPLTLLYGLAILAAFPLAVFGIVPNALIGDVVEAEEQASGKQLSGMFYGVRAFVMKLGISVANLLFPSLLLMGKSIRNPRGVQLTAVLAVVFCLLGWQIFRRFREVRNGVDTNSETGRDPGNG